ncbi:DMT family transporter [Falsiroseomonas ponticola]|uniref:DMT family transporter n=1 Tax=Falsiroseomonas ponticola TaxID=2786951 RepID=UPI0019347F2A|nr:DMT family transporter [Roseomonas ponticola]
MSPPVSSDSLRAARTRAILLVIGASATFTVAAAMVKAIGTALPVAQVVLFRNLFALPLLLVLLARAGGWEALRTRHPGQHLQRALWGMFGMFGAFHGYANLPIATVTALGFTMPLFLTALSVVLLKEQVGWRRWSAVVVGFVGVLIMVRPFATGDAALPPISVGIVLLGSVGWALAMMTIRRMGEAGESGVAIVIWFALISAAASAAATVPVWVTPDAWQWTLLVGIGLASALAQLQMTAAYRRGETTLLAPFEYSGIIWTMIVGIGIWAEWPDGYDLLGFGVLVAAGLYIWRREVVRGARR